MTTASGRRVAKLEGSLPPCEAVLAWLADAQQFPTLEAHVRSIADLPVEAAPLSLIGTRVAAAVRALQKGRPRDDIETAVGRAVGDAVFLFCLVLTLNGQALDVARVEGLRAAALFWWMGALLGGPHEPPRTDQDARERSDTWRLWRSVVEQMTTDVRVETEARAKLEQRYLGGHNVLFADAGAAWADHIDLVRRLGGLAEVIGSGEPPKAARWTPGRSDTNDAFEARVGALASRLADDARVRAYEILGDRPAAVRIIERRLRS